jgi:hypothetical protein
MNQAFGLKAAVMNQALGFWRPDFKRGGNLNVRGLLTTALPAAKASCCQQTGARRIAFETKP